MPAFDCQATAALLRSLAPLVWASHVAALLGRSWPVTIAWLVVVYFAVRVELDARLFELLAREQDTERLDAWLAHAGLHAKPAVTRSIEQRCAGARRLGMGLVAAWIMQMATLAWRW